MDEQQIKALIAEAISKQVPEAIKATLSGDVLTEALKPLATAIQSDLREEFEELLTKPDPQPNPASGKGGDPAQPAPDMATKAEIAKLKKQLEEESKARVASEQARQAEELRGAILAELGSKNVKQQSAALKLLQDQMQFKRENGQWFTGDGENVKTLSDAVSSFLETEVGGLFVAPSGTQGAGTTEAKPAAVTTGNGKVSDEEFARAFGF